MRWNSRGFTLTEILIVTAIIGVLSTIGIPAYKRLMQRSRKIEAKVNLGNLYAAEQAFYANYTAYGNNLYKMGFRLDGSGGKTSIYSVGFASGSGCTRQSSFTPLLSSRQGRSLFQTYGSYYTTTSSIDPMYARAVTVAWNRVSNVCVSGLNSARGTMPYSYFLKDGFDASSKVSANSNVYSYLAPGSPVTGESNGFFATADGVIAGADVVTAPAGDRDIWFIDHERTLVNIHDGAR